MKFQDWTDQPFLKENTWYSIKYSGFEEPSRRSGSSLSVYRDTSLFLFGGVNDEKALDDLWHFDLENKRWTLMPVGGFKDQPSPRASATMLAHDSIQRLYLFGGTQKNVQAMSGNQVHCFDILKREWNRLKSSGKGPCQRFGHSMNIQGLDLLIFGGVTFSRVQQRTGAPIKFVSQYLNDLWLINLVHKIWIKLDCTGSIPNPRYRHQTIINSGTLWLLGGTNQNQRFGYLWGLDLKTKKWQHFAIGSKRHKKDKSLFRGRYGHGCALQGQQVLIYGGTDDSICEDSVSFNLVTKRWSKKMVCGRYPQPREYFASASSQNKLYIFGGRIKQIRINDMMVWSFRVPSAEYVSCSLPSELYAHHQRKQHSQIKLNCQKQIFVNKAFLRVRMPGLQTSRLQKSWSEALISWLYTGQINYQGLQKQDVVQIFRLFVVNSRRESVKAILLKLLSQQSMQLEQLIKQAISIAQQPALASLLSQTLKYLQNRDALARTLNQKQPKEPKERQKIKKSIQQQIDQLNQFTDSFKNIWLEGRIALYRDLQQLKLDDSTSDLTISTKFGQYKVHKFVMAARSQYFEAVQGSQISLGDDLVGSSQKTLQALLDFIYQGAKGVKGWQFPKEALIGLLLVSNYFMIRSPSFNFLLETTISQLVEPSEVISKLQFSASINAKFLQERLTVRALKESLLKREENWRQKLSLRVLQDLLWAVQNYVDIQSVD